jgi:hypothetical protein
VTITVTDITLQQLKQVLRYDPTLGIFQWLPTANVKGISAGSRAGSIETRSGYRRIKLNGKMYTEHRLVWFYVHGVWPTGVIDHINHDRSDNRIQNLRDVTHKENMLNKKALTTSITGHQGIWFNQKTSRYVAEITKDGKKVYQKSFTTANLAIEAREAKLKQLGFHENHGF